MQRNELGTKVNDDIMNILSTLFDICSQMTISDLTHTQILNLYDWDIVIYTDKLMLINIYTEDRIDVDLSTNVYITMNGEYVVQVHCDKVWLNFDLRFAKSPKLFQ